MRLKEGFITHESEGQQIMVGTADTGFAGIVRSNKTAAFIVEQLKNETTPEEIVEKMLEKYDAPREVIENDVNKVINELRGIGAIDE